MAKDKITEYDATANNNTVCGDVNIAENSALPSDMNNFAREIMSHLKEGLGSGTPLYVDQTNNRLGINTSSPATALDVTGTVTAGGNVGINTSTPNTTNLNSGTTSGIVVKSGGVAKNNFVALPSTGGAQWDIRESGGSGGEFTMRMFDTSGTHNVQINSNGNHFFNGGNVGIGTSSPDNLFHISGGSGTTTMKFTRSNTAVTGNDFGRLKFENSAGTTLASISAFSESGNTEAGIKFGAGGGDTERMRIDSSGNVGIGTSSPSSFYSLADNLVVGTGSGGNGITIYSGSADSGYIGFNDTASASMQGFIQYNHSSDYMAFAPNGSERMRIMSDGRIGHFATSAIQGAHFTQTINSVNGPGFLLNSTDASGNTHNQVIFRRNNSNVGSIQTTGSSTVYVTSSDHRLKENVVTDWDATTRLKQLNPVRFNFIADADTTVDGFLAHEVQSVVPEAITGTHNEVDADGNPVYQGIDQSKLVPLLVKTIQELEARIVALETA